jgi:hypothetical protein
MLLKKERADQFPWAFSKDRHGEASDVEGRLAGFGRVWPG